MNSSARFSDLSDEQLDRIDACCEAFEQSLLSDESASIDRFLIGAAEELRDPLFRELLTTDLEFRISGKGLPDIKDYHARFPGREEQITSIFQAATNQVLASTLEDEGESIGTVIGVYKLQALIGQGGMGLVYAAEQEVPVRRKVALKIIKPGMDSKEVIARFEIERQALALMNHPNISHVLDAGITDNGRPYFVMELIRGVPITEFCNAHQLSMDARLELFVQVCLAVQHAHQKGIIHRDLKPSNILVTLDGETAIPKIIDFGLAKAIHQRLTDRTADTQMSQVLGTPLYMSPEQAEQSAKDIDTRTDIYSLGVLLYELLTGTTPFTNEQFSQLGSDEIRRLIREEQPPVPSLRLSMLDAETQSTVSQHRDVAHPKLIQLVRGELDWIVMKAMEKDFTRRYATASDFAADVKRYLADEAVLACPPSAAYWMRKFARRNKAALAIAALVCAGLLIGTIGLAVSNLLIRQQMQATEIAREDESAQKLAAEAERERADANLRRAHEAVDRYFMLVSESTLLDETGLQPLRKELIENAAEFYQSWVDRGNAPPHVMIDLANIRLRLGTLYYQLTSADDALDQFEKAFDLIDQVMARAPADSQEFLALAGFFPGFRGTPGITAERPSESKRNRDVMARGAALWNRFAAAHPDEPAFLSDLYWWTQDEALLKTLVEQYPQNRELRAQLARTIFYHGFLKEDPSLIREAIATLTEADLPVYRGELAGYYHELGWRLMEQGAHEEAAVELMKAVDLYRVLTSEFPQISEHRVGYDANRCDLASALWNSGQPSEAEKLATDISPRSGSDFALRGNIYKELRQNEKAISDYAQALQVGLVGQLPNVGRIGIFLAQHKQYEQAILFYDHGIKTNTNLTVSRIYADRGAAWARLNRYDKALEDFTQSIEINAWDCEHHLSRLPPRLLREGSADFQNAYLQLADRAIEVTEGIGQSYLARSQVYLALGEREKAKTDLRRGIEVDPDASVRVGLWSLRKELQAETSPPSPQ